MNNGEIAMMTMAQITKVLGCCKSVARVKLKDAGIPLEVRPGAITGGVRFYYRITPEELKKLKIKTSKTPAQKINEQSAALSFFESVLNNRRTGA